MDTPAFHGAILYVLCAVSVVAAPAGDPGSRASSAAVDTAGTGPRVCIHVIVRGRIALSSDIPMKVELARIWRLNGVAVVYPTAADPQRCDDRWSRSVVVFLVDRPEVLWRLPRVNVAPDAVAVTTLCGGALVARIHVFVGRAERLLEGTEHSSQLSLSLMVARLAAHEVGHVLLGSRSHASCGLMRGTYDLRDAWLCPDHLYLLTARERETVHRNLASPLVDRPARASAAGQPAAVSRAGPPS